MKTLLILATAALAAAGAAAETNVGISISVAQPGVYGRIDIGNFPPPAVVLPQPVIITGVPVQQRPVYLYVPPGHQKNWKKHCGEYGACGQPVYFVQESWVQQTYEERRGNPGKGHGQGNGHSNGKGNGKGKD
jgi:hypothetical protein